MESSLAEAGLTERWQNTAFLPASVREDWGGHGLSSREFLDVARDSLGPISQMLESEGTTVEPGALQGGKTVMSLSGLMLREWQTLLGRLLVRGRTSFRGGCGCVSGSFEGNHGERDSPLAGAG